MTETDRKSRSTRRIGFAILALLGLAMSLLVGLIRHRSPDATQVAVQAASASTENLLLHGQQAAAAPPGTSAEGTVAICGFGSVALEDNDFGTVFRHIGGLTAGAAGRWLSALKSGGDLRGHAAALVLEGGGLGGELSRPAAEKARDTLAQLAADGADPAVYALAWSLCTPYGGSVAAGACQQISLRRWAEMDPGNAAPWLLLAGNAFFRKNTADEADAFRRAAQATVMNDYSDSLYAFAESQLPRDVTPLERTYLAIQAIGIESTLRPPSFVFAGRHCTAEAMQDSSVREQCAALAELLVSKGTNLLDLMGGTSIGERSGWSAGRVSELTLERNALSQALTQAMPSDNATYWTCDSVDRTSAFVSLRASLGELGAARDLLERSGETRPVMAEKYTQFLNDMRSAALKQEQEWPGVLPK